MKPSRVYPVLTHLACLALGWWVCAAVVASKESGALSGPKDGRRQREIAKSGTQILDEVLSPSKDPWAKFHEDFQRLRASMEEPADFAAALDRAVAKWDPLEGKSSPEIAALFYKWMEKDPMAAFAWGGSDPNDTRFRAFQHHGLIAFIDLIKDKGWNSGVALLGSEGPFADHASAQLAQAFGAEGDASGYARLRDMATPATLRIFRAQLAQDWPDERRDELLQLAMAENAPEMLRNFIGKGTSLETMHWMRELAEAESLPAAFRSDIASYGILQRAAMTRRDLPLVERLALVGEGSEETLALIDLNAVLNEGRDWRYAMRHGQATATDVLSAISREIPDIAGATPDFLRTQLYWHLVEEDSAAAQALLEGLPESERNQIALQATRVAFKNVDPGRFLDALEQIPVDSPESWEMRLGAWNEGAEWNHTRLSEDYVAWVRGLPPGLDREMGLFSLANAVQENDPDLASDLRGEIRDEKLLQRLEGRQ